MYVVNHALYLVNVDVTFLLIARNQLFETFNRDLKFRARVRTIIASSELEMKLLPTF